MRRSLCCGLALVLSASWAPAAEHAFDERGDDHTELQELLRLPARYWAALAETSEGLDRALERHGLTPRIGGVVSGSGFGFGVTQHFFRDGSRVAGWSGLVTHKGYEQLGLYYARELDPAGRTDWTAELGYRHLDDERFFGLGLDSRAADRAEFRLDELHLRSQLGLDLGHRLRLYVGGDVRHLTADFEPEGALATPAYGTNVRSFDFASFGVGLAWDTRDEPGYARRGSLVAGDVRQVVGIGPESPSHQRLALELQNVLPLPLHDHVLATRLRADWTRHAPDVELPFFLSRGLGGSHSLRSFSLNRFRGHDRLLATVEYRHGVLPGKLDAVAFWDAGGVFGGLGMVELDALRHSFGAGVRVLHDRRVLLRLELAHGAEGTRFLVSFSAPF